MQIALVFRKWVLLELIAAATVVGACVLGVERTFELLAQSGPSLPSLARPRALAQHWAPLEPQRLAGLMEVRLPEGQSSAAVPAALDAEPVRCTLPLQLLGTLLADDAE